MLRWALRMLMMAFLVIGLAPSVLVVHFHLRRSYIERELCVQREVAEGMRTCHGECQLSKRLNLLEREAEKGFPAEELQSREFPMIVVHAEESTHMPAVRTTAYATERSAVFADGHARSPEHVPWY